MFVNAGAATWGDGVAGIIGAVSPVNSLVGTQANDRVGLNGAAALTNGNYVVRSSNWKSGTFASAGAATWGSGVTGIIGAVSPANSLVGTQANDQVGVGGVSNFGTVYVVRSPNWANGAFINAGAASIGDAATGTVGVVSSLNSLVGTTASTSLGTPQFSLLNGIVIAGFPGEVSGRVRVTSSLYPPIPPQPPTPINPSVSASKLSAGAYVYTRVIANIYQLYNEIPF